METPLAMITGFPVHFLTITMGILFMGALLDIHIRQVNTLRQWCGIFIMLLIYVTCLVVLHVYDDTTYRKMYPALVHFPIMFSYWLLCKYSVKKVLFSFVTTLTMMSTPLMIMLFISRVFPMSVLIRLIILFVTGLLLYFALRRFAAPCIHFVFEHTNKRWWLYLCIPVIYWLGGYCSNQYSITPEYTAQFQLINGTLWLVVQFSYLLIFSLFNHMKNLYEQEEQLRIFAVQQAAAQQMMEQLRTSQTQSTIYRHDMRHHLSLLSSFVEGNDVQKIGDYIKLAQGDLDAITPVRYCENETVSLILFAFETKAKANEVTLKVDAKLPTQLSIPDTELCAVLSNGLENAISAASQIEDETQRTVEIKCFIKQAKLLLMIENPYIGKIEIENGIPVSVWEGHGFGCRSIATIAKRRKGHSTFVAEGGIFILRVVLPFHLPV